MTDEPKDEPGPSPSSEFVESLTIGPKGGFPPRPTGKKMAEVIDYEVAAQLIDQLDNQRTEKVAEMAKLVDEQAETPEEVKAMLHDCLEHFKWLYEARTAYATYIDKDCFVTWQIKQDEQGKLTVDQVGLEWVWLLGLAGVLEPAGFQVDIRYFPDSG